MTYRAEFALLIPTLRRVTIAIFRVVSGWTRGTWVSVIVGVCVIACGVEVANLVSLTTTQRPFVGWTLHYLCTNTHIASWTFSASTLSTL